MRGDEVKKVARQYIVFSESKVLQFNIFTPFLKYAHIFKVGLSPPKNMILFTSMKAL